MEINAKKYIIPFRKLTGLTLEIHLKEKLDKVNNHIHNVSISYEPRSKYFM